MAIRVGGIEFTIKVVTGDSVKALKRVRAALTKVIKETEKADDKNRSLASGVKTAASAMTSFAAAVGAVKLINLAKESVFLAAKVTTLGIVLDNVGRIAGLNSAQIRNLEDSVKRLGITTRQARQGLAQLAQANLDLRSAAKLTRVAQDAAVIAGVDSSEAFNRLVVSIQRNDVRLLRNLGIVINLNNVYAKFSQTTGRTVKSLTAFEKRNVLLNEVLQRGRLIQGTYEASLQDVGKQISSLRRLTEEASLAFGKQFLPVLREGVKELTAFLKAFPKGEAFVTPAQVAAITATVGVMLGLAAAITGVVAAAGILVAVLGGPVTIALAALVVILSTAAGVFVKLKLDAAAARVEFQEVGNAAEQAAQRIFEAREIIGDLDSSRIKELTTDTQKLNNVIAELISLFPEFTTELEGIKEGRRPLEELTAFLEDRLPLALKSNEDAIESLSKKRVLSEQRFRDELLRTFQIEEGATDELRQRVKEQQKSLGNLAIATKDSQDLAQANANAQARFADATRNGSEAAIQQEAQLIKTNAGLTKLAKNLIEARRQIIGLRQANLTAEFAKFEGALQQLEDAANQALQITGKLETKQREAFKGTAAEVALNFLEIQDAIRVGAAKTDAQLEAAAQAFRKAQFQNARDNRDARLLLNRSTIEDTAELTKAQDGVLRTFAADQKRIEAQATELVKRGQIARATIRKAEELSIENLTETLRRQDVELKNLLDRTELEIRGVSPKLLNIRKRLTESLEEQTTAMFGLGEAQARVIKRIREREEEILAQTGGDGVMANLLGLTDQKLQRLKSGLAVVQKQVDLATARAVAARKSAEFEFDKEAKSQIQKLEQRERELITKINKLRALGEKEAEDVTIQGVAARVKAAREGGEDLKKFLKGLRTDLRGQNLQQALTGDIDVFGKGTRLFRQSVKTQALPALKELSDEALNLQDQLKKATNPEQVKLIGRAFSLELRQAIVSSRTEITGLKQELEAFQKTSRPETERDNRIEQQRRFNELVDAGVPARVAQAERDKQSLADRQALDAKEKEITDKIKQRQQAAKQFEGAVKTLQAEFAVELQKQTDAIAKQVADQTKLNELKREELAIIREQGAELATQQAVTRAAAAGGVGAQTGAIPTNPPQTGSITQAVDSALSGLSTETGKIVAAEDGTTSAIERLIEGLGGLGAIRERAEEREQKVERLVDATLRKISDEAKAGSRVLKPRM